MEGTVRVNFLICIVACWLLSPAAPVLADITNISFEGNVTSEFDGGVQNASSTLATDNLLETVSANNSFTTSDLNWNWDGSILTGSSETQAEKTVSARPGGNHFGSSTFSFSFDVDQDSMFQLDGFWGTNNLSPGGDVLQYQLVGPSSIGPIAATGTTGINSETISNSGSLAPGSYTLTFTSSINETINNQNSSTSGWIITAFSIATVAVPEPSAVIVLLAITMFCVSQRHRYHRNLAQ